MDDLIENEWGCGRVCGMKTIKRQFIYRCSEDAVDDLMEVGKRHGFLNEYGYVEVVHEVPECFEEIKLKHAKELRGSKKESGEFNYDGFIEPYARVMTKDGLKRLLNPIWTYSEYSYGLVLPVGAWDEFKVAEKWELGEESWAGAWKYIAWLEQ